MNKTFNTLFILFLGILFFILTFTANSEAKTYCLKKDYSNIQFYHGTATCTSSYMKIDYKMFKQIEKTAHELGWNGNITNKFNLSIREAVETFIRKNGKKSFSIKRNVDIVFCARTIKGIVNGELIENTVSREYYHPDKFKGCPVTTKVLNFDIKKWQGNTLCYNKKEKLIYEGDKSSQCPDIALRYDGQNHFYNESWTPQRLVKKEKVAKKEIKKKEVEVAKKKLNLKCVLFNICEPTHTQQTAKKEKKEAKKVVESKTYHCVAQDKSFPEQYLIIQVRCPSGYKSVSADEYANIKKQKVKKVAKKKIVKKKKEKVAKISKGNCPSDGFEDLTGGLISCPSKETTQTQQVAKKNEPAQTTNLASKKIFKIGNKKLATQSDERCVPNAKGGFTKVDGKIVIVKRKYCIFLQDIAELGIYQEFNAYPEGMLKEFKNCKKFHCQSKIASKKMYDIFVRRGEQYHARHPEKMIHGMAWFEIVFLAKHKKTMPAIERYAQYKQGNYNYKLKGKKSRDESEINSLIGMNKGRKNMRVAMGLSMEDDLAKVLKRHWLLGDFLGNDQVTVKKVKMNSEIKKRKELLTKYQAAMKKYKTKLEEEKNKKDL